MQKIIAKAPQQFPHLIQLLNWAICNLFISEIIFILKLKIPFSFLKRENIILFTVIYILHLVEMQISDGKMKYRNIFYTAAGLRCY